ncbi:aminoglycoside adenylyltransferase family protein [Streptomyces sp. KL116D]|uniref:aminoglycoside adenylyltransferase family protein n=1 Tax=Streptomyces sp. KL116D TaxID=3045152 RepID=UPI0035582193
MEQAGTVVDVVREVLGPGLVSAHLYGSAVSGGLRPHSDVDVFAVTRRGTTRAQRERIVAGLLQVSGERAPRGPFRPVELTIVAQDEVRPWRWPPRREFQYGEWLRDAYERGATPEPGPDPDLALLVTMVLRDGVSLYGPPAGEVLAPVPAGDVRRAAVAGLPALRADLATDTRNVLLTLARIWATLATGDILSKDAAADWALPRLPTDGRAALARARAVHLGELPEDWSDLASLVPDHAELLLAGIGRLADG